MSAVVGLLKAPPTRERQSVQVALAEDWKPGSNVLRFRAPQQITILPNASAAAIARQRKFEAGHGARASDMPSLRSCVVDRRQHSLARQWQIAHAHADRVEHRVGDRRRDRTGYRLADAERRLVRSVDDGDLDRRRFAEAQD